MKTNLKNLAVFAGLLCVASCQKKDSTPVDLSRVNVAFSAPGSQQVFHKGDTVNISAYVTYIAEIKGIGLEVIDTTNSTEYFSSDYDLHSDHFSINESWVDTLSAATTLMVKVSVFVANNTSEPAVRAIYIKSQP